MDSQRGPGGKTRKGCYTRLLQTALNIKWIEYATNKEREKLMLAGHCYRHPGEMASRLVLWSPSHGRRGRGGAARTFIKQLEREACLEAAGLPAIMRQRHQWRAVAGLAISPDMREWVICMVPY